MAEKVKSPHMGRREFTKIVTAFLGSIMGIIAGIPIIGYVIDPALKSQETDEWIPIGPLDNYPVGTPTAYAYTLTQVNGWERTTTSHGGTVLRHSQADDDILVLSNRCTHLSCRVRYNEEAQTYNCPCHDAKFDIDGEVIYGPPPEPLEKFAHKIEDGVLLINPTPLEA
jgi:menaquinol-cytochrome c reductase iron-sulfur subunit